MRHKLLPKAAFIVTTYPIEYFAARSETLHRAYDAYIFWWEPCKTFSGGEAADAPSASQRTPPNGPNKITGANAGRPPQLPIPTRRAARIAQFRRSASFNSGKRRGYGIV